MKKRTKIILLLFALSLVTGCTNYKKYDGNSVTDNSNGQRMIENILCKTEKTEEQYNKLKNEYLEENQKKLDNNEINNEEFETKKNEIENLFNIENVQECSNFSISDGKDDGLWTNIFVKSLSWLIVKIGTVLKNYGWAIIVVTLLIRTALYPFTKKSAMQSENMKAAKNKLDKLELKYKNRNDKEAQMMKSQEMMAIYKEYNINPASGCIFALIQIPLFFAFYEALYRLPVVLEENFFGINLGITPTMAFKMGNYYYIIFIVLVSLATYYSFKLNSSLNESSEQAKQMKMMTNFSVIMISFASLTISTGIAIYWIANSSFTIIQNLLVKRSKKNDNIS